MQAFFSFPSFYEKTTFFSSLSYILLLREKTISSLFSLLWHQYVAAVPYILFFCHACAAWLERDRARAPTCQVSGRIVVNTHSLVMEALIRLAKPCHPPSLSPTSTFHFFSLSAKSPTKVQVSYSLLFRLQSPSQATYCWSMMWFFFSSFIL